MRVLVVGDLMVALSARVDRLPLPGQNLVVDDPRIQVTGVAANLAWNLRGLGLEVEVASGVGRDALGETIVGELRSWGVGTGHVERSHRPTALFLIMVDGDGERTMVGTRGASERFGLDPDVLGAVAPDWVHVSGYAMLDPEMAERCARLLGSPSGVPCSIGLEGVAYAGRPVPADKVTVFCNLDECRAYFGSDAPPAEGRTQPLVVRRGSEGCDLLLQGQAVRCPGFLVPVVDATGAGDAFDAGYIAARLSGSDPEDACRWGNGAAAIKVQTRGARADLSVGAILDLVTG